MRQVLRMLFGMAGRLLFTAVNSNAGRDAHEYLAAFLLTLLLLQC